MVEPTVPTSSRFSTRKTSSGRNGRRARVVAGEVVAEERGDQHAQDEVDDDRAGPAAEPGDRSGALGGQPEPYAGWLGVGVAAARALQPRADVLAVHHGGQATLAAATPGSYTGSRGAW